MCVSKTEGIGICCSCEIAASPKSADCQSGRNSGICIAFSHSDSCPMQQFYRMRYSRRSSRELCVVVRCYLSSSKQSFSRRVASILKTLSPAYNRVQIMIRAHATFFFYGFLFLFVNFMKTLVPSVFSELVSWLCPIRGRVRVSITCSNFFGYCWNYSLFYFCELVSAYLMRQPIAIRMKCCKNFIHFESNWYKCGNHSPDTDEWNALLISSLKANEGFRYFDNGWESQFGPVSRVIYFICEVFVISIVLFAIVIIFKNYYLFAKKNCVFLGRSYLLNCRLISDYLND